ncbi:MAG: DsbA family protein [Micrococcales bacterium]|nr:DsbA family protein [Micrococcales bacterium]
MNDHPEQVAGQQVRIGEGAPAAAPQRKSPLVPALLAVIAGLLAVIAALLAQGGNGTTTPAAQSSSASAATPAGSAPTTTGDETAKHSAELARLARRQDGDPLAMGKVDAPVVMLEYSDFTCPFCAKFATETKPALIKRFVDAGVLRIEWRDFPYRTDGSLVAAKAARAAGNQGRFWQFHDALFAKGSLDAATEKDMAALATSLGLDAPRLTADMKAGATTNAVGKDFQEGQRIGVNGTPSFIINGRPVVGAQPQSVFEQIITEAATAAKRG